MSSTTRVVVNLPTKELDQVKALAKKTGLSLTALIRRAIALEVFLAKEESNGAKVLLEEPDGSFSRVLRT